MKDQQAENHTVKFCVSGREVMKKHRYKVRKKGVERGEVKAVGLTMRYQINTTPSEPKGTSIWGYLCCSQEG